MRLGFTPVQRSFNAFRLASLPGLMAAMSILACTPYKASDRSGQVSAVVASGPLTEVSVVVANTKLAALGGPLTARITFDNQTASQDFTPGGTQSELKGIKLPSGKTGVMTVEILQGNAVKFIAKRANTRVESGASLVVDDCLILRSPWAGTVNEGSCEWNITEVAN